MKRCDICLVSKAVRHKLYGDLQFLPVSIHCWKNLLMDFVTGLPILTDWKGDNNNSIRVIVNWLIKIVYYKPVKVTIDASSFAEVIIDVVVRYYGFLDSIVTNRGLLFTLKFLLLLCYFLGIKRRLSTTFYPQTDGQTKKQNSSIDYLRTFVNFEQNDGAWLLSMAEFAYNNAKNASTGHTLFELNCRYYPWVSYKENLNLHLKSKTAEELSFKLWNLMAIC